MLSFQKIVHYYGLSRSDVSPTMGSLARRHISATSIPILYAIAQPQRSVEEGWTYTLVQG